MATARQFLEGNARLWLKNDRRRLGIALDDAFSGTPDRLAAFHAALPRLNAATVNAALRAHLPPVNALRVAIVTAGAAEFKEALVQSRPSPKTYNAEKPKALLDADAAVSTRPFDFSPESIQILPASQLF